MEVRIQTYDKAYLDHWLKRYKHDSIPIVKKTNDLYQVTINTKDYAAEHFQAQVGPLEFYTYEDKSVFKLKNKSIFKQYHYAAWIRRFIKNLNMDSLISQIKEYYIGVHQNIHKVDIEKAFLKSHLFQSIINHLLKVLLKEGLDIFISNTDKIIKNVSPINSKRYHQKINIELLYPLTYQTAINLIKKR